MRAALIGATFGAAACGASPTVPVSGGEPPEEHPVRILDLAGPAADASLEISGLAWHGDDLILLPERLGLEERGHAFVPGRQLAYAIPRRDLREAVAGARVGPLSPRPVEISPSVAGIAGIDGFEGIAIVGDDAYLTVETYQSDDGANPGFLLRGRFVDADHLELDLSTLVTLSRPSDQLNTGFESVVVAGGEVIPLYERGGDRAPRAPRFDARTLEPTGSWPCPPLPFRVTDLSAVDARGHLWALNYHFPRDVDAPPDPLADRYGRGATHRRAPHVERLVELVLDASGFSLADRPPLQLVLDAAARNWEGLARLDDLGLLIITDKHPRTLLGFVAAP